MMSVELECHALDEFPDSGSILCVFDGNTWIAQEPHDASDLFRGKTGYYEILGGHCLLWDEGRKEVRILLKDIDLTTAKVGLTGEGRAFETRRNFTYQVNIRS
jgi:hypothetical protein